MPRAVEWRQFKRRAIIAMEYFDQTPCRLDIPVRYLDGRRTSAPGVTIYAANRSFYSLRREHPAGPLHLECTRWVLGGLAVLAARDEVTNPAIRAQLLNRLQAHPKR